MGELRKKSCKFSHQEGVMEIWTISALGINQIDASNYSFLN
jgi:hypothetical protein